MTSSTLPWTSGAAQVRRRHRLVMFATTAALIVVATTVVTAVSGFGWLQPNGAVMGAPLDGGEDPERPGGGSGAAADAAVPTAATPVPSEPTTEVPGNLDPGGTPDPAAEPVEPATDVTETSADETQVEEPDAVPDMADGDDAEGVVAEGSDESDGTDESDQAAGAEKVGAALSVSEVQERLRVLGYLVGAADGQAGQQATAAIMAFQRVHDLQVDGVVGPQTSAALTGETRQPELRGGPATRIEVDLDRQILHLVEDGERIVTMKVSSGNGELYRTSSGGQANARTPVGDFVVERRIHGVRTAALGALYDPLYFHGGFAIHGSPSVPAGPASHGCVRVSRADASWLIQRVPDGTPVQLYGGTHVFTPSR